MAADGLIPTLDTAELDFLESLGERRLVEPGGYLYREGDRSYDFYALVSGQVEIVLDAEADDEQVIITHGPGRFLGELNLLTGQRAFLSARVLEAGEVIALPAAVLRRVIATEPQLGDKILAAFMARRHDLRSGAATSIRVIGSRFSAELGRVREFLVRNGVPHAWIDPETDPDVERLLDSFSIAPSDLPVVIASGTVLRRPTPGELASYLGLTVESLPERCFDLVVVGGGPAGLAAAVYGASEGLRTLTVDMIAPGGQASASSRIENYLGFPTGVSGADLTERAVIQAEKFGARLSSPCTAVSLKECSGHLVVSLSDGTAVAGRAVIAASGAHYRRLGADRLADFEYTSVYYAATEIEARSCAASPVVVVGGGNSAGQAAVFLADSGSTVSVVIRAADLNATMSRYLIDRIEAHPRIELLANTQVVALAGDRSLASVRVAGSGGESVLPCVGLFSFIGADPASEWLSSCAALDDAGFVLSDRSLNAEHLDGRWDQLGRAPLPFETNRPGLFAAGDLRSGSTKRVAAAVGEGSTAVRAVHEYLAFTH